MKKRRARSKIVHVPFGDIIIDKDQGTITTALKKVCNGWTFQDIVNRGECCPAHSRYNAVVGVVEGIILKHALAGIDVADLKYADAIREALVEFALQE